MSTATITTRTRMAVQDTGRPFIAAIPVDGVSSVFDLPVESISDIVSPPIITLAGVNITNQATPQYVIDYKLGVVQFGSAPEPAGAQLIVQGWTYDYFTDDEVAQAVVDSFNLHVNDQDPLPVIDPTPGQPSISTSEEYLVSIRAAIELLWWRSTDAAQEIDIHTPEGVTIPRSQRYEQIVRQITALEAEYSSLSLALGVGIFRIQVLNQRRVSLTTNRLVPIYREQEYNQPYTGFEPTAAIPGSLVTIYGKYFTAATDVQFGGVSVDGAFTVVSDSEITATVPANAVTGQIAVVTPYGMVLSTAQFVVGEPPPFILSGPEMVKPPIPPGL